jgi:formate dehydrogenase subunit gamma
MATKHDAAIASEIISRFGARPEMLLQVLHAFMERYGFIAEEAIRQIAGELNLSRAEVHGVVSFYHDFRTDPPGRHVVKICQSEACQAMGSRELTAHAEQKLGTTLGTTAHDGSATVEPVYCLGLCACAPAVLIDGKLHARVDADTFDALVDEIGD